MEEGEGGCSGKGGGRRGGATGPDAMLCVIDYLMRNLYLARIGRMDGLTQIELAFPFRGGKGKGWGAEEAGGGVKCV